MSHLEYLMHLAGRDVRVYDPAGLLIVLWSTFLVLTGFFAYAGYKRSWSPYVTSLLAAWCATSIVFLFLAIKYV